MLGEKPDYSHISELLPFEIDLTKVYKLKITTSKNVYAVINESNNSFIIL